MINSILGHCIRPGILVTACCSILTSRSEQLPSGRNPPEQRIEVDRLPVAMPVDVLPRQTRFEPLKQEGLPGRQQDDAVWLAQASQVEVQSEPNGGVEVPPDRPGVPGIPDGGTPQPRLVPAPGESQRVLQEGDAAEATESWLEKNFSYIIVGTLILGFGLAVLWLLSGSRRHNPFGDLPSGVGPPDQTGIRWLSGTLSTKSKRRQQRERNTVRIPGLKSNRPSRNSRNKQSADDTSGAGCEPPAIPPDPA